MIDFLTFFGKVGMFLNMMQDWAGWLLMLFSFSIVLMWKQVRSDTKIVCAIWFCIFMHHAVVLLNAYVGSVIGTEGDARTFHFFGVEAVWSVSRSQFNW